MPRVSVRTILKEWPFWMLLLIGLLFFFRPVFLGETLFFRDLCLHDFPDKQLLTDFIAQREWPLWDPYTHGGCPYFGNIIHFVLYPTNFLYLLLPTITAFNVTIVIHFIGAALAAYLIARELGLRPPAGFVVGIIYGFCGYTLSLANILNRILALPYIPLMLFVWHRSLLERKTRWFLLSVMFGVFQVFAGAPETNVMTLLFLASWALLYPYPNRSVLRKIMLWGLLSLCILGISAIQLIPTLEVVSQSVRGKGIDYKTFSVWSFTPKRIVEFGFPGLLGFMDTLPLSIHFWGGNLIDEDSPYILSTYWGWIVLLLAIWGGLSRSFHSVLPLTTRRYLLILCLIGMSLSMGRFLPGFEWSYQYIPFLSVFRFPIKFFILGLFPLSLLAGVAFDLHFGLTCQTTTNSSSASFPDRRHAPLRRRWIWGMWGSCFVLMALVVSYSLFPKFSLALRLWLFGHSGGEVAHQGVLRSFLYAAVIWLLWTLLYHYRYIMQRPWQAWLAAGILTLDLLVAGHRVNVYAPTAFYTEIPDIVPLVRQHLYDGRFFRSEDPTEHTLQVPTHDLFWSYRWSYEVLKSYTAAFYRIPVIFHEDVEDMTDSRMNQLTTQVHALSWEQRLPLLSAGSVRIILTSDRIDMPEIRHLADIPNRSNLPFALYQNTTAAARAEFVTIWQYTDSAHETLEIMLDAEFDPRSQAVLETPQSSLFEPILSPGWMPYPAPTSATAWPPAAIRRLHSNVHAMEWSVKNACDGYLVLTEPWSPGWHMTVNSVEVPIWRANYAFSAVFLPAGTHQIHRFYRPNSIIAGVALSTFSCIIVGVISWKKWGL